MDPCYQKGFVEKQPCIKSKSAYRHTEESNKRKNIPLIVYWDLEIVIVFTDLM